MRSIIYRYVLSLLSLVDSAEGVRQRATHAYWVAERGRTRSFNAVLSGDEQRILPNVSLEKRERLGALGLRLREIRQRLLARISDGRNGRV